MKIIDLTLTYRNGMRGVNIIPAKSINKDGWNANTLSLYSHAGTHMDAPPHFGASKMGIDEMPLENCIGKAWIIDIPDCKKKQLLGISHLEQKKDKIQEGDSLIFRTGWSTFVDKPEYRDELPRISAELARWCVRNKIKMLAVEPPSVADVTNMDELTEVHKILLNGGVTIVEGLTDLESIDTDFVELYAIPLKIYQGDGAPARVFAIIRE
jgi:kynurenine formamidase